MLIACIHVPAEVLVRHSNTVTSLLKSGAYGRYGKSLPAKSLLHTVDEGVGCLPIPSLTIYFFFSFKSLGQF